MSDRQIQVDSGPEQSPWFLPVAVLAMALLLVAIALSEDSVAPITLADDPGPNFDLASDLGSQAGPSTEPITAEVRSPAPVALRELVPGFDGTLHLWVRADDVDRLLVWSDPLAEPRPMDLPAGTTTVDLNVARLKTLVVTDNRSGNGVLWLGDRNHVQPALIFETPIHATWHESDPGQLAVSRTAGDHTEVIIYDVLPGNVLVESERLEVVVGRGVEWFGDPGVSLAALDGKPVAEWVTHDGESTTYSRHLIQSGGRPIFDICTGVPCRPTFRLYLSGDGTLVDIGPEVVQVTHNGDWQMVFGADGTGIRRSGDIAVTPIPISGPNAWSGDGSWLVFEQEASLVGVYEDGELVGQTVRHPIGFLRLDGMDLYSVTADVGHIEAMWLP